MESVEIPNQAQEDRDLERRVLSFLWSRHMPGLRCLEVEANQGVVTLRGRVSSFYEKQLCHQACQRVAGVRRLHDRVDVAYQHPDSSVALPF